MNFVLDASVALKFYVPEVLEAESARLLNAGHRFHVPDLIFPEFGNIIWKKVRLGELSSAEAHEVIDAFSDLRLITYSNRDLMRSAFEGATATGRTVYDWTYLSLAISLDCQLVTADRKFYEAIAETPFRENLFWIGDQLLT